MITKTFLEELKRKKVIIVMVGGYKLQLYKVKDILQAHENWKFKKKKEILDEIKLNSDEATMVYEKALHSSKSTKSKISNAVILALHFANNKFNKIIEKHL